MLKFKLKELKEELNINRRAWQIYLGFLGLSIILFQVNPQKYGVHSLLLIVFGSLCYYIESIYNKPDPKNKKVLS